MNLIELLQQYAGDIDREKGRSFDQSLSDDDYEKDERAGILEHEGGLSREQAEEEAGILPTPRNENPNDFGYTGSE